MKHRSLPGVRLWVVALVPIVMLGSCALFGNARPFFGLGGVDENSQFDPSVDLLASLEGLTVADLDQDGRADAITSGDGQVVVGLNASPDESLFTAKPVPGAGPVHVAPLGGGPSQEVLTSMSLGVVIVPDAADPDAPDPYLLIPGNTISENKFMASGDIDGDGDTDLIVAEDGIAGDTAPKVRVVSNNAAQGVLPTQATAPIVQSLGVSPAPVNPLFANGVVSGNLNGDADPDVVFLSGNNLYEMVGGAGVSLVPINTTTGALIPGNNLTANSAISFQNFISTAVLEDVNNDGLDDLITVGSLASNSLRLNTGNGVFGPAQPFGITGSTLNDPEIADIDQDGKLEIVAIAGSGATLPDSNRVFIVQLAANGSVESTSSMPTLDSPTALGLIDAGDDGFLDLLVFSKFNFAARVHRSIEGVILPGQVIPYIEQGGAISVAEGDFNNDGFIDLVFSGSSNKAGMCLNTGDGSGTLGPLLSSITVLATGPVASVPAAPGSPNAGKDLVAWNSTSNAKRTYLGAHALDPNNNDLFQLFSITRHDIDPVGITVGDFNADGRADFAVAHDSAAPGISIALQGAAADFPTNSTPFPTATGGWNGLARYDLDATGGDDLLMIDDNALHVLRNDLFAAFSDVFASSPLGGTPVGVAVGDINGDGRADAIVALDKPGAAGEVAVFYANPDFDPVQPEEAPVFIVPCFFAFDSSPTSVAVGDVNGDAFDDVVVSGVGAAANQTHWCTTLVNDGAGDLLDAELAIKHHVGRSPRQVILADLNTSSLQGAEPGSSDALPELIASCSSFAFAPSNGVTVLANKTVLSAPDCPGDADADLDVDFNDLNLVLFSFGQAVTPGENGDVDDSGFVDFNDLNAVLFAFGAPCPD